MERDALRLAGGQGSDLTIADYSKLVIADIIKTVGKPSALGSKESSCGSCSSWRRRVCSS